ncbi:hypothetical protein [Pseudonocardia sp.]|uniref:hypothetical protein n=1 Tax=Pseudonocardia sp. TaxID=60912 RepID=UPI0031FCB809
MSGTIAEIEAEQVTPAVAEHGEGPVWDARSGRQLSVDMHRGRPAPRGPRRQPGAPARR